MLPEAAAAADDVLPEAGLTLVHAGGCAHGERCALERGVDALLVHGVPRLVQRREQRFAEVVLLGARRDAHVADGEGRAEGMGRLVLATARGVEAESFGDAEAEGELAVDSERSLQAGVVGGRSSRQLLDQRHEFLAQALKQRADRLHRHAVVGAVDQGIGDVLAIAHQLGRTAAEVEDSREVIGDGGEVVGRPRLGPCLIALGARRPPLGDELGRQLPRELEIAARDADESGLVAVGFERLGVWDERIEQAANLRVGETLVGEPRDGRLLAGAGGGTAGRHVGRLIPVQDRHRPVEVVDLGEAGLEVGKRLRRLLSLRLTRARSVARPPCSHVCPLETFECAPPSTAGISAMSTIG